MKKNNDHTEISAGQKMKMAVEYFAKAAKRFTESSEMLKLKYNLRKAGAYGSRYHS